MNTPNDVQQACSITAWKVVCKHSGEQANMLCMNLNCDAPAFSCCKDQHCLNLHEHQGTVSLKKWDDYAILMKKTTYVSKLFEQRVAKLENQFSQLLKGCKMIEDCFVQKVNAIRLRLYQSFPGSQTLRKLEQQKFHEITGGQMSRFIKLLENEAYREYRQRVLEEEKYLRECLKNAQQGFSKTVNEFNSGVIKSKWAVQNKQLLMFLSIVLCMVLFSSVSKINIQQGNQPKKYSSRTKETWLDQQAILTDKILDTPFLREQQLYIISSIFPNDQSTKFLLAISYYKNSKLDQALDLLEGLSQQKPRAQYYYLEGLVLQEKGEIEQSLNKFEKASKIQPENAIFVIKISSILRQLKRYKEAIEKLESIEHLCNQLQLQYINHHTFIAKCMLDQNCEERSDFNDFLNDLDMNIIAQKPLKKRQKIKK